MIIPIQIGITGYSGLKALEKIEDQKKEMLTRDPVIKRQINYFKKKIEYINSPDDLVNDQKLFKLTLGAFGIDDQTENRAMIRKALASDLEDEKSIANRIPDKRILRMAKAFDFFGRTNPYSREEGDFLNIIGLGNSDLEVQKNFLSARKKMKTLLEPYGAYVAGLDVHYTAKKKALAIAIERGDLKVKEAIEKNESFADPDEIYPHIPERPLAWKDKGREWHEILKDPDLSVMIKSVFGLSYRFDYLPDHKKIEKIKKIAGEKLNFDTIPESDYRDERLDLGSANLFYQLRKDRNLNRFFRTYAYNSKKTFDKKQTGLTPEIVEKVADNYIEQEFRRRVGLADETMRLSLNARSELSYFAERGSSKKTLWLEVLGNPPLRKLFETAFGFGREYAKLDIDRQFKEFSKASRRLLGTDSFSEINKPKTIERLLRTYHARAALSGENTGNSGLTGYSSALSILTGGSAGGGSNPILLAGG